MKRPRRDKGGQKAPAPDEDDAIWRHTAATIEPLKKGKARVHTSDIVAQAAPRPVQPKAEKPSKSEKNVEPPARVVATERSLPKTAQAPQLAEFDRRNVRKIRAGRVEIEARIDLHGMRQDEAHAALVAFVKRSHSRGLRFVLVITGKGRASGSELVSGAIDRERGVLKRNVPRWLDEPDIRGLIVSFTTAAIAHGGDGALYVHLRNKDRR